jgi:hypothetical protein
MSRYVLKILYHLKQMLHLPVACSIWAVFGVVPFKQRRQAAGLGHNGYSLSLCSGLNERDPSGVSMGKFQLAEQWLQQPGDPARIGPEASVLAKDTTQTETFLEARQ